MPTTDLDYPRPTVRHLTILGCEAETWVIESAYHGTTEVVAVAPAMWTDEEPGYEVVWTVAGDRSSCDWSESRAKMVAAARALVAERLAELVAEWIEWTETDDGAA